MISSETRSDPSDNAEESGSRQGAASAAVRGQSPVEYDGPALVELSHDDVDYRIDVGKQGTALCISTRPAGTWDWSFGGEARWENRRLRARGVERDALDVLGKALAEVVENQ
jgi:hypothetical protein